MVKTELLLKRLDQIGESVSKISSTLALIGLGSVGKDLTRLDQYSDLDFFVIVKSGSKNHYLENLEWLEEIAPVAFFFKNTPDGYKLLYEDGVFCEFAVFDEDELKDAVFSPGRIVWKADGISDEISVPLRSIPSKSKNSVEWLIGEALTNLFVGLSRDRRGEKLSALRFIQGYAVDRILELVEIVETDEGVSGDRFDPERRFEERFPLTAKWLPGFLQGYERNRESAKMVLSYLEEHFDINPTMKQKILDLCS